MSDMALKLPLCFFLLIEKPVRGYFQVQAPYYQAAQSNYSCILKVTDQV